MNHPRSLTRFGDDLADAMARPASTPSRARSVVAVVAAVAAVMAAVLVPSQLASADDVTVSYDGDTVFMQVRTTATAEQITEQITEHGLDVAVLAAPTGPSRIGTLARSHGHSAQAGDDVSLVRFNRGSRTVFYFGEPAKPGEPYGLPTDGFDELEPFHDLAWMEGRDFDDVSDDLMAAARSRGIELTVERLPGTPEEMRGRLEMLRMVSDRTAMVYVAD
jgi:hypothetical protein